MIYAIFEDATSTAYGATNDRPILSILSVIDVETLELNLSEGQDYVAVGDIFDTNFYKIIWNGSFWELAERVKIESLAAWNKTTITADGVDAATLGPGLPVGIDIGVYVPADSGILTDGRISVTEDSGTFTLTTESPGVYTIDILAQFPYAPYLAKITAE